MDIGHTSTGSQRAGLRLRPTRWLLRCKNTLVSREVVNASFMYCDTTFGIKHRLRSGRPFLLDFFDGKCA